MAKRRKLEDGRAPTVPRETIALEPARSTIKWPDCTWRTADGMTCEADDPRRDYLVTRYGKEVPRLFIDEGERLDRFLREHPNWAEEQRSIDSRQSTQ